MDRLSRLGGITLAYDLCYDAWDEPTRSKVRTFLLKESKALLEKVSNLSQAEAEGPERITTWATAGLAELAVLGDMPDAAARGRIVACEEAVVDYMKNEVAERGIGLYGESVKQAAFASGILPFVHANRLVLGRDLGRHPAVQSVLIPALYQTVPDVGMPILGPGTTAKDRSGLFAMGGEFLTEHERPAVAWLFQMVGGDKYSGVVRPHQGLYMLGSGLRNAVPKPPGKDWPRYLRSDRAKLGLFRTRWKNHDDLVTLFHDGTIRILGMGARWVSQRGIHSNRWSDSPGAGAMENVLGFNARSYRTSVDREVTHFGVLADAAVGSMTVSLKGQADRLQSSIKIKEQVNGKKVEKEVAVPPGGSFRGYRAFAVDYTGRCGAPALFVIADHIEGAGEAPRQWVLHAGYKTTFSLDGPAFKITNGETSLIGKAVSPEGLVFKGESNPPYTNFIHAETDGPEIQVIMILQRGKAPVVVSSRGGLQGNVSVGERTIRLSGDKIVFGN
jgi:hypothetical protein